MTSDTDIDKVATTLVEDMLALEPDTSLFIHFADSDMMGMGIMRNNINPNIEGTQIIGVGAARVRHRIAFNLELPVQSFMFLVDQKSDLEDVEAENLNLVLWDYLHLSQPLAEKIVYRPWKRLDLIVIVPQLSETSINSSLKSLVKPEMLLR